MFARERINAGLQVRKPDRDEFFNDRGAALFQIGEKLLRGGEPFKVVKGVLKILQRRTGLTNLLAELLPEPREGKQENALKRRIAVDDWAPKRVKPLECEAGCLQRGVIVVLFSELLRSEDEDRGPSLAGPIDDDQDLDNLAIRMPEPW